MRIHTHTLTRQDVRDAARVALVDLDRFEDKGSRSHDHAYDIILSGASNRRQNGGDNYAATWDQWGIFLAYLFDLDASMVTAYDKTPDAFHARTANRFNPDGNDRAGHMGYAPNDMHGDHTLRPTGTRGESGCTKCTAVQRY